MGGPDGREPRRIGDTVAARTRPAVLAACVGLIAALLTLVSYSTGAFHGVELMTVDTRFGVRGTRGPDPRIVLVGLDQKSLASLNERPPVSRVHYAHLLDHLRGASPRLIGLDVHFIGATEQRDDAALLGAVARNGPILLVTDDTPDGWVPVPAGRRDARGAVEATGAIPNDPDGLIRRMLYAPVALKTFAVRAAELIEGSPVHERDFGDNHAWIDFLGPPGTFPTHSFVDVIEGRVPQEVFRDKAVLVGVTDPVNRDVFATPASSRPMAGVELHANALSTILRGFPLRSTPWLLDGLVILLLAAVPAVTAVRLSSLHVVGAALLAALVYVMAAQILFNAGWIVPVIDPLIALGLAGAGAIGVDVFTERRQRERLQATLDELPTEASTFFISYRRDQSSWPARILNAELVKRFGESSVFMDVDSIAAGQKWPQQIEDAIRGATVVLVLIGPYWLEARDVDGRRRLDDPYDWVRLEIETALEAKGVAVVPILLDGAAMPDDGSLVESIRQLTDRNAVSLTPDGWGAEIEQLVESIRRGRLVEFFAQQRAAADSQRET